MNTGSRFPVAFAALVASLLSCGRPASSGAAPVRPLPPDAPDAGSAPSADAASDAGPAARPVGRKPRVVRFEGESVGTNFAELAAPSVDHPRGTIVVASTRWVEKPGAAGEGTYDAKLVEIDVATGAPVRSLDAAQGVSRYVLLPGATGPIGVSLTPGIATVVWFDRSLAERFSRTFKTALSLESLCRSAAVGDRILLADCGTPATADVARERTSIWSLDPGGVATLRRCPGATGTGLWIEPWGPDMVLVEGLHGSPGKDSPCAFRADGRGGVTSREVSSSARVFAMDGRGYFYGVVGSEGQTFPLGPDLRPTGPMVPYPEKPPEVAEVEKRPGLASTKVATPLNGSIILQAIGCCGETSGLYILDPHADGD